MEDTEIKVDAADLEVGVNLVQQGTKASTSSTSASQTRPGLNLKPTKPVVIECEHVSYFIGKKQILHDIHTQFKPGELCALMGGSGAGKTTLLTVVSGMAAGRVTGEVLINKKPLTPSRMKKISNLVPQLDVLIPVLTARETLRFAAAIRLPLGSTEREKIVNGLLKSLSLEQCADVLCGDENVKGLSGGQRKRVSVGLELMTNPAVLFLDEPTSGLDSKVAEDVVRLLQEIALSGRTVICTIHQPNFQVFNMFSKLLMLSKGRTVYDHKVSELSNYLANGLQMPTPTFINPVDHFMSILSGDVSSSSSEPVLEKALSMTQVVKAPDQLADEYCEMFRKYAADNRILEKPYDEAGRRESLTKPSMTGANMAAFDGEIKESKVSNFQKFFALCRRVLLTVRRDKKQMTARIFQQIFIGLIVGSIYYQMPNTQNRIMDRQSALFMIMLFTGMSTIMQTVTTMPVEKAMLLREYRNGYYGTNVFFFSRMLVILTLQILYALLHSAIVYPLVGFFPAVDRFFIFFAALSLASITGSALGFAIGTIVPTIEAAVAIVPMAIMPMNLFSGLLIAPENIPNYWIWMYYLSFFQYPYQIFMVNEFHNLTFQACDFTKGQFCPLGPCPADPKKPLVPGNCTGDLQLNKSNYKVDDMPLNFGIQIGYFLLFFILGWVALQRLARAKM